MDTLCTHICKLCWILGSQEQTHNATCSGKTTCHMPTLKTKTKHNKTHLFSKTKIPLANPIYSLQPEVFGMNLKELIRNMSTYWLCFNIGVKHWSSHLGSQKSADPHPSPKPQHLVPFGKLGFVTLSLLQKPTEGTGLVENHHPPNGFPNNKIHYTNPKNNNNKTMIEPPI